MQTHAKPEAFCKQINIQMQEHCTYCIAYRKKPKKLGLTYIAMCSCKNTAKNLDKESTELHMTTYRRIFILVAMLTM